MDLELYRSGEEIEVLIGLEWKQATYIKCLPGLNVFFCRLKHNNQAVSSRHDRIRLPNHLGKDNPNKTFKR